MAITVKHTKVSTIPDGDDSSLIRPSDWNDDHQLTGTVPVANGGTGASTLTGYVKGNGTSTMTASSTIPNTDVSGLGTMSTQNANNVSITGGSISGATVSGYIPTSAEGVANGVATLDSGGQIPLSQIPPLGDLNYQGAWNASTNSPTLTSSVGTKGYYYVVSVAGSTNLNGITDWKVSDWAVFNGSVWQKIDNTDAVTSVNGYTGAVTLTYTDVGAFPATSTTGSGNVVLATGPTLNNPNIANYEAWTGASAPSYTEGLQWYDSTAHSLAYYNDSANSIVHIGQDIQVKVINNTGSTIANGSPVYITSTSSGQTYPNVALAKADVAATSAVIGLTNGAIANGAIGYVTSQGGIDNVNTGTFTVGQVLYLSPYSAGQLMNTIPPTGITVQVGVVSYVNSSTGKIYVKQTTPLAVPASIITGTLGVANGGTGVQTITGYVKGSGTSAFTGSSTIPTTDLSGTITNAQLANSAITINGTSTSLGGSISVGTVTSVGATAPIASSGGNTPTISISQATTSTNGYLSSTDWNTFNNKGSGSVTSITAGTGLSGGTITSSGTIAIDSTVATLTGAQTLTNKTISGASNTLSNIGNSSLTNSAITINGTSTSLGGSISVGTVTSVTGTAPVVSSGGATPAISMAAATGSVNGYLTSTDWTTFNGKQTTLVSGTNIKTINSNSILGSGDLSIPASASWQTVQTANFTAASGNAYPINTTSGAITVTFPSSPTAGNIITVTDYAGTWGTNNLTINPNGNKLDGSTTNAIISTNRESISFVYVDSTQGWIPYSGFNTSTPNQSYSSSYLIVAGGGGGGGNVGSGNRGAGGGAGGLLASTLTLTGGTVYTVTVGAGGAGGVAGTNSSLTGVTATVGGGYGGVQNGASSIAGGNGGSGGGGPSQSGSGSTAGGSGTSGQGNAGAAGSNGSGQPYGCGGGGGAGAAGSLSNNPAGSGGVGLTTSLITTTQATTNSVGQVVVSSVYFAGGGGGGTYGGGGGVGGTGGSGGGGMGGGVGGAAANGGTNTGGGGGGQEYSSSAGANGGSGCVLLSVPTANYSGTTTGSPVVVTNGSNTVMIFKSSGSYTA